MIPASTIVLNDDGTITETRIIPAEIDLVAAAQMLGLDSRTDVLALIGEGRLTGFQKFHHTFVKSHDVVALHADLMAERRAAVEALRAIGDDADL